MTDIRLSHPISGQDIICWLAVNEATASIVAVVLACLAFPARLAKAAFTMLDACAVGRSESSGR